MAWFRITLSCSGLTEEEGRSAPTDVLEDFSERNWHKNAICKWDPPKLVLIAENDFDENGAALYDEFWDVVIGCVDFQSEQITFEIESVVRLADSV